MRKFILNLAFISLFLAGCYTSTTQGGLVRANSRQLLLVSAQAMDASAAKAYVQTLSAARNKKALNVNPAITKRVQDISARLISQVHVFRQDALKWNWQVNVIQEDTLNAWCMPGGKIAVYSGIITRLNLTDGEIAAIIGHEIAHALREHSREQASNDQIKNLGVFAISAVTGVDANLVNLATHYTISLPFSRAHETEADHIGTELMARAGYDPSEAVNVWVKMSKVGGAKQPEILSTHPSNESRIADLKKVSAKVKPLYLATLK